MDFDNPYASSAGNGDRQISSDSGTMNAVSSKKLPDFSKISKISHKESNFTYQTKYFKDQFGPIEPIKEEKPGDDEDDKNKGASNDSISKKDDQT